MKTKLIISFLIISCLFAIDRTVKYSKEPTHDSYRTPGVAKIGDNPFPTNPMSDRAKGFVDQGRVKSAVTNYGSFINWDTHPSGIWGDYSYLPSVSFIAAVPGHSNTAHYTWEHVETVNDEDGVPKYSLWESSSAYDAWYPLTGDTLFAGFLFELDNDDGKYLPDNEKSTVDEINDDEQFVFDHDNRK
ncbi:MAG: hypothetical protein HOA19_06930, partial [Candidatus Marinimicrobia bacterium]|nr:hypothetical protein [Candidatus Neomarinimicrobiota bacterium]MBT7944969.1 hypothetical protein [Candidatus Neomarinimicrobiota bacterium]